MRSATVTSALLLALGAGIGLFASSQQRATSDETVGIGIDAGKWAQESPAYAAIVDDFDAEEATGSIGSDGPARLSLDDEQRGFVFIGIINLPDVPELEMLPPRVATTLPGTVDLHDIPAMVVRKIPQLRDYRFVKLSDRILLVGADDRRVAVAIPRYKLVIRQDR